MLCPSNRAEWNRLWACAVLGSADFPDARLGRRAALLLAQQAERPGDGLLHGAGDAAAAKGSCRLLENDRVTAKHFWEPIHAHTAKGLGRCKRILCIQDTTTLMFPGLAATTGLGTMQTEREEALLMHSALAVRPDGQVLGLLGNDVWARPPEEFKKRHRRKSRPIEEKESYKWIRGIRQVAERRNRHSPATKLLHVFDREGDVHEVLQEVIGQGDDGVIRCNYDRNVDGPYGHIRATLAARPVLTSCRIGVPRKQGRRKRQAAIEVRSAELTLTPARIYPAARRTFTPPPTGCILSNRSQAVSTPASAVTSSMHWDAGPMLLFFASFIVRDLSCRRSRQDVTPVMNTSRKNDQGKAPSLHRWCRT